MDSRFHGGGPLSRTETAQKVPLVSSTGIRAPLTIDDSDSEYSVSTSGQKDDGFRSDSELESDGSMSGKDEFETASGRPFVADPNGEVLQETNCVEEYVVSRPFVKNLKTYGESDNDEGLEELVEGNSDVEEYGECRPFVAYTDEDDLGTPVEEEENSFVVESPVADSEIALLQKQGMPIAQLSGDSDDDFLANEIVEDGSFSGVVRAQCSGVWARLGNAPRVLEFEKEEEEVVEDSASQTDYVLAAKGVDESVVDAADDGVVDSGSEGNCMPVEKIDHDLISAEMIADTGPSVIEEAKYAEMNDEIPELERNNFILSRDLTMPDPTNYTNEESNYLNANLICEEGEYSITLGTDGARAVLEVFPTEPIEDEFTEVDDINNFEASFTDCENGRYKSAHVDGTVAFSWSGDNEKLVSGIEHNIQQKVKSHGRDTSSSTAYSDGVTMENEVQIVNHAELWEGMVAQRLKYFGNDHVAGVTQSPFKDDKLHYHSKAPQDEPHLETEATSKAENDSVLVEEDGDLIPYDGTESIVFESSEVMNATEQPEQLTASDSLSHEESSWNHLQAIFTEFIRDSEEMNTHRNLEGEVLCNNSPQAAVLRSSPGVGLEESDVTFMSKDGTRLFFVKQLAGLDSTVHSPRPTTQSDHPIFSTSPELMVNGESKILLGEQELKKLKKLQQIRGKFLHILHRLNQSPEDPAASRVLHQLLVASGRSLSQESSFDFAKTAAMELEAEAGTDLDFSLNILVIGKSGVGKSSTINSIFGEHKAITNAFEPGTTSVKEIKGTLDGVQVRALDTPGLRSSIMEQSFNRKVLSSIKKFTKKFPVDVVLYVDRVDLQSRDLNDLWLLKSVNNYLGSSIWLHTIVILTHADAIPPDGPSGNTLCYESYVTQKVGAVRQLIGHCVGDLYVLNPALIPISLIENQFGHEMHQNNQSLMFNQESWRSELLLLCYSMKILSEIDSVATPKLDHSKFSGFKFRSSPLPYFLSSLLQWNAHLNLSTIQGGEHVDSDRELAYLSCCNQECEDEYDQLPPFKPLRKSQIANLNEDQRRAYFKEYDYRVKLVQKKQWKEESRRFRGVNKDHREGTKDFVHVEEDLDQKTESPATVVAPLPDMELPPSFDADNPAYRYRYLVRSSPLLIRPLLDSRGWDHDRGYDSVNIEDNLAIAGHFPAVVSVQLTKDKRQFNIHWNSSVSGKHGEKGSTVAVLDVETLGKHLAYSLKTETKMKNFEVSKSTAGISVTLLDRNVFTGLKVQDQIAVGKDLVLVGSTGLIWCRNDAAHGANLGFHLRKKDYPISKDQSIFGISLMRWRGDLIWGLNLQSQFSTGHNSRMDVHAGLNTKKSGHVSVRMSSSDNLHIAMFGLLPIAKTIFNSIFPQSGEHRRCDQFWG